MATIRGVSHLLLQTRDLARAERFYVEVLGFHVRERTTFRDGRPLIVMYEGLGLTELTEEGKRLHQEVGQSLEHVAFCVENIVQLEHDLRAAGVTIVDGPKPTAYGTSLYFLDPDGVRIECHD
ncbi:VOC family protein [Thermogemmatispora sp.]|uniref:VOC family protein n=1 Tax=Thermogemmatispora sp. TaxID=1968838 RepID=UPI001DEF3584|nr:VOC family protein [Thermogemmatispora sp.]MBX5449245.1 VOC family protein [Thermogemmatispora sp.]